MGIQKIELNFSQFTLFEEIKLRGNVMVLSADLEFLLLKIIVACLADVPNEKAREFKTLPLEQKIVMLKHDLKNHKIDQYNKFLPSIKKLDKIKTFRNKFAHCKIEWDKKEKDISFFYILIISDVKGKEKPQLIKMTYTEYWKKSEQMRAVLMDMLELCKEIEDDFYAKYPDFFKAGYVS
jgi:hypothetical protein